MIPRITVGVLALQGAFYEHLRHLEQGAVQLPSRSRVEWQFIEVRTPTELGRCDALVIPGGESTTVSLVAARSNMLEPLRDFTKYSISYRVAIGGADSRIFQGSAKASMGHLRRSDIAG